MGISGKFVSLLAVLFFIEKALAATFTVGGEDGWQQSNSLETWPSSQIFKVGDELEFKYSLSLHSVVEVPNETSYENCNITNPLQSWNDGNSKINLSKTGIRYFVCGTPGHCEISRMKVKIKTVAANDSSSSTTMTPHSTSAASSRFFGFFAWLIASLLLVMS